MIKYQNYKDKVRRQKFLICENERLRIKSILHNRSLPFNLRLFLFNEVSCIAKRWLPDTFEKSVCDHKSRPVDIPTFSFKSYNIKGIRRFESCIGHTEK